MSHQLRRRWPRHPWQDRVERTCVLGKHWSSVSLTIVVAVAHTHTHTHTASTTSITLSDRIFAMPDARTRADTSGPYDGHVYIKQSTCLTHAHTCLLYSQTDGLPPHRQVFGAAVPPQRWGPRKWDVQPRRGLDTCPVRGVFPLPSKTSSFYGMCFISTLESGMRNPGGAGHSSGTMFFSSILENAEFLRDVF